MNSKKVLNLKFTKKIGLISLAILVILILFALFRQVSDALQVGQRLDNSVVELQKLQAENKNLKKKLSQTQKYESIEQILRDKLNMARPNETVVVISPEEIDKVLAESKPKPTLPPRPNWQAWLKLFF